MHYITEQYILPNIKEYERLRYPLHKDTNQDDVTLKSTFAELSALHHVFT